MARDVIITPASGLIDFQGSVGVSSATIELDTSGNLNIACPGGDLTLGDTSRDLYIGNGVANVDIIFEQDGEIRGLTGRTITLGQSDSYVAFAGNVTGNLSIGGTIVFPDNASVPDNPTNEQYDYMTFGANGSISQISGRGGLMFATSDDSLVLANGDVGRTFTSSNIDVDAEDIFLLSDGPVRIKSDLQNGWGSENDYLFSGGVISSPRFTSTQSTGTAPFTVSSTTVVTNLNADTVDGIQGASFLRSDADDTATGLLTLSGGINVSGVSTFQSNVNLGDNDKINLGDGSDLQIYHDGSENYIDDAGVGSLLIRTLGNNNISLKNSTGNMLNAAGASGAVELYYNNTKKFETTGYGVTVSGGAYVSGISTFQGGIHDGTSLGTNGQVLSSTGTGLSWINAASGGASIDILEVMLFS